MPAVLQQALPGGKCVCVGWGNTPELAVRELGDAYK